MLASSSISSRRIVSRLRSPISCTRYLVSIRSRRMSAGGTNEGRSSPCSSSCAIYSASRTLVFRPGTAFMRAALSSQYSMTSAIHQPVPHHQQRAGHRRERPGFGLPAPPGGGGAHAHRRRRLPLSSPATDRTALPWRPSCPATTTRWRRPDGPLPGDRLMWPTRPSRHPRTHGIHLHGLLPHQCDSALPDVAARRSASRTPGQERSPDQPPILISKAGDRRSRTVTPLALRQPAPLAVSTRFGPTMTA